MIHEDPCRLACFVWRVPSAIVALSSRHFRFVKVHNCPVFLLKSIYIYMHLPLWSMLNEL